MTTTYKLGISSVDALTLYPEWDYWGGEKQIRTETRAKSGRLRIYKWYDFDRFRFDNNWVPASDAAIVNSWWDTNTKLLLFITSTDVASNLLTYGHMEQGSGNPWAPPGWGIVDATSGESLQDSNSWQGSYSVHLKSSADIHGINRAGLSINSGESYVCIGYAKRTSGSLWIRVRDGDFTHTIFDQYVNSGYSDWAEFSKIFNSTYGGTAGALYLMSQGSVDALVDYVNIYHASSCDANGILTGVHSVMIMNDETPLASYNKPYDNRFRGKIELEGY